MNREKPEKITLKLTTLYAVKQLQKSKNITERQAVRSVFSTIRQKHIDTGFKADTFQKFYQNFKKFKHIEKSKSNFFKKIFH